MPITKPNTELENKAWEFAKNAHQGVKRKFQTASYFDGHVAKVFGLVKQYDTRPELGAAALLHDTIEDVDSVTYEILVSEFGKVVADLVKELTSNDEMIEVMGKADYLLDKMYSMSDDALIIKLCDRLQNISDSYSANEKFRSKYYSETRYILEELASNRQLNRVQKRITEQINGLLDNIKNRYHYESLQHLKRFTDF